MKVLLTLTAACLAVLAVTGVTHATQSPLDEGNADSVLIRIVQSPNASTGQNLLTAEFYFLNDVQMWTTASLGFKWVNPNLVMDSASLSPVADSGFDYVQLIYRNGRIDSTNKYDVFQLTLSRLNHSGWAVHPTPGKVATFHWHVTSWTEMDEVVFDSIRVLGTSFTVTDDHLHEYKPTWNGPVTVYDPNRPQLSNIILSDDHLDFEAIQNQPDPAAQTVQVTSDNLPQAFQLVENSSWLLKTPSSGTTPANISVSVNTLGLTAGLYEDSIRVDAPGAENTPLYIHVTLDLQPPLPEIVVNRSEFFFNAIAGGANPPPQTLSISNAGSSTLNWTVTKTQSWLSPVPGSGSGDGDVSLNVDVTGLGVGTYHDVVTVSAPEATNSPVDIPVTLAIGSDLPILVIDSQHNRWVVDINHDLPLFTRKFGVRNGGPGTLNYWVESSSTHILYFTPSSGEAPDSVTAVIYYEEEPAPPHVDGLDPYEKYDTVYVYSNEAINSPVEVIFHYRFVLEPSVLQVSTATLEFDVYPCQQGEGVPVPSSQFMVTNGGDDEPMRPYLTYDSDLLQITGDATVAPVTYTVKPTRFDLAPGLYYDTVIVTSPWASNNPKYIPVTYTVLEPPTPEIVTVPAVLDIPWQEDSGPLSVDSFRIGNVYGGCMEWEITESLDWLSVVTPNGQVPGHTSLLVNPPSYTLGTYPGSLSVTGAGASNSPLAVPANLKVWRLHGDWNWNGRVTMQDIAEMANYIAGIGQPAQPGAVVGDCTCDGQITAADVAAVIDYLFISLEPICGNPY